MTHFHTALLPPAGASPREVATALNQALKGKINAIAELTLMTNTAATVFTDPRLTKDSWLGFDPVTINAGTIDRPYVRLADRTSGSCIIRHPTVSTGDVQYLVLIIG